MALFLALTLFQHLIDGFRNCDLRGQVADLLGVTTDEYTSHQMTYDLRRPRLQGADLPAEGTTDISSRLEGGPTVLASGSACLPARYGRVHPADARSCPFPSARPGARRY